MIAPYPRRARLSLLGGMVLAMVLLSAGPALAALRPGRPAALHLSGYQAIAAGAGPAVAPGRPPGLSTRDIAVPVAEPPDGRTVVGPPSLSPLQIDMILGEYGSPAAGQGAVFVALGRQYGIDPAFALAFYVHESHCGTRGVARFTHGIGNIRWTPGFAAYEGYRAYPTFAAGIEDWFKLIRELYVDGWGLRTVDAIVPRYAPAGDSNDPPTYIANVESLVATWRARAQTP